MVNFMYVNFTSTEKILEKLIFFLYKTITKLKPP